MIHHVVNDHEVEEGLEDGRKGEGEWVMCAFYIIK